MDCVPIIPDRANAVWVSDITYIWMFEGWRYLAAVLDLFSRVVVGLAMDQTIAATLVTQFVKQAILRRNPGKGLIFTRIGVFSTLEMILRHCRPRMNSSLV